MIRHSSFAVAGGELAVTEYGPEHGKPVYAPHGITANSQCWLALAELLPDHRIIAPDLRGRGRSNALPGPFGLEQHAQDAIAVMDQLAIKEYEVYGHSMGAFVSVRLAEMDSRISSLVLIDGGIPLSRPKGVSDGELVDATLGPAAQRLKMEFGSKLEYQGFWSNHPAFASDWTNYIANYVDYDLQPIGEAFKPASNIEAVSADILELFGPERYLQAMSNVSVPVLEIRAPRGLMNDEPLYPSAGPIPGSELFTRYTEVSAVDVNHYTILLNPAGASQIAQAIEQFKNEIAEKAHL